MMIKNIQVNDGLIDAVVPFFGSPKLLRKTVQSISRQNGAESWASVTVVDDGCPQVAYLKQDNTAGPHVVIVRNPQNIGLVKNWNRCLKFGSAGYVCLVHCDDLLHPDFLNSVRRAIRSNPMAGLIYSQGLGIVGMPWTPRGVRTRLRWIGNSGKRLRPEEQVFRAGDEAVRNVLGGVLCSSAVINREAISELRGFREDLPYSADEEFWPRIASRFDVVEIPEKLVAHRSHAGNHRISTWLEPDFWNVYVNTRKARLSYIEAPVEEDLVSFGRSLAEVAMSISSRLLAAGEYAQAKAYLARARNQDDGIDATPRFQSLNRIVNRPIFGRVLAWLLSN